jgi:outer membrane protein
MITLRLATVAIGLSLAQSTVAADLRTIYDIAVNNDPQLGIAKATFMSRNEQVVQARSALLPQVRLGANLTERETTFEVSGGAGIDTNPDSPTFGEVIATPGTAVTQDSSSQSWTLSIQQPIFRLDAWFLFRGAKNLQAQAQAEFASAQQDLIVRAAEGYLNILEAQDLLTSANAERDAVQRQLEQVQQRFDVGLVAITDVLEARAAYDTSTVSVIEAEGGQVVTFETLLRLTGEKFDNVSGLSDVFPVGYPDPHDEEAWVQTALQQNLELIAARESLNVTRKQLQSARAKHLPTLDAFASANHSAVDNRPTDTQNISLSLNVPLYSGGAVRSASKQAAYQMEQAQRNFDLVQRQTVESTRNLFSAINTDVARVRARLKNIESIQSALDATETGYEVGTRNIVDVLVAQQRLFLAQFQYASARYRYIKDTLRLKANVGALNPQDIYDLNAFLVAEKTVHKTTPSTQ